MKEYWYNVVTKHLYTDSEYKHPFLCAVEATPLVFESPSECSDYLEEQNYKGNVLYEAKFMYEPRGGPKEWQYTETYFLDWDETNGEQYNLIVIPRHLYDYLHGVDEQTAAANGWKVPLEDGYYYFKRYDGVRNTIIHMLEPYGTYEEYQRIYGQYPQG